MKAIIFLSTPHRGSPAITWPVLLANIANVSLSAGSGFWGRARSDLIRNLEKDSTMLHEISVNFRNQVAGIKMVSCYEQNATPPHSHPVCPFDFHGLPCAVKLMQLRSSTRIPVFWGFPTKS